MNNVSIQLKNAVIRRKIPKNENPDKVIDIVEEIFNFNKRQKGKGLLSDSATNLKILTPTQMLQTLPISLAQVQADNTSENLLNEIRHSNGKRNAFGTKP